MTTPVAKSDSSPLLATPAKGGELPPAVEAVVDAASGTLSDVGAAMGNFLKMVDPEMRIWPGLWGYAGKMPETRRERGDYWESIHKYLRLEIAREKSADQPNEERIALLETATAGVFREFRSLKGKTNKNADATVTPEATMDALKKLGIVIDSPQALKYFAHRCEVEVELHKANETEAYSQSLAAELAAERRAIEGEKASLEAEVLTLKASLKVTPFDQFIGTEDPKSLARLWTTATPKDAGASWWKQTYDVSLDAYLDLREAVELEKPDGPQAQEIRRAMFTFSTRLLETAPLAGIEPFPAAIYDPNPMSMEEACRVLSQVHSKLTSPLAVRMKEIPDHLRHLEQRERNLASREPSVEALKVEAEGHQRLANVIKIRILPFLEKAWENTKPSAETLPPVITGNKNVDRFLSEIGIDKEEWTRAKGTKGALISEKLRDPDCTAHPELAKALHVAESWLEEKSPYANPEPFVRDLIKAYIAGLNADSPAEASELVSNLMEKHLKSGALAEAERAKAEKIIERVEEAAKKEREAREEKEKKGI